MSKALRLSEKWFRRGLWLVAFVFAGFLIGLGGTLVNDLPKVEKPLQLDDFLDRAAANRLRATMFNQGNNALARPEYVRDEVRARMWIGNHTFTHPHLPQVGEPGIFMEIASTQWVLRNLTGREPKLFRPPYGETNAQVRADLQRIGLLEVLWTVDSRDWAGATAEQIAAAARTLQPRNHPHARLAAGHHRGDPADRP